MSHEGAFVADIIDNNYIRYKKLNNNILDIKYTILQE